ncbi:MAG TPA: hypothetical protein VK849_12570 [Longimicrobiales bacterium]|nr:hypothetical protein [Longimicrobiales bacterium]
MRRTLFTTLAALNGLVALALFAAPAETQIRTSAFNNCCRSTSGGHDYCCWGCCWFITNCSSDSQCGTE